MYGITEAMSKPGDRIMYLDSEIRNWILIPIMVIMLSVGVLTHYINSSLYSSPVNTIKMQAEKSIILRSKILRANAKSLPVTSLNSRRAYMIDKFTKATLQNQNNESTAVTNPTEDPRLVSNMKDMLTKYMASIIPQTVIMTSINFFFSGLIIATHYKDMLQRGIETRDMDPPWISSLSWYILNLFGLKSLYKLLLDSDADTGGLTDMSEMASIPMAKPQDMISIFRNEIEYLQLIRPQEPMVEYENYILKLYSADN